MLEYLEFKGNQFYLPSLLKVTGDATACNLHYPDFEIELEGETAAFVWAWWESGLSVLMPNSSAMTQEEKAKQLGITVTQVGSKWYARSRRGVVITSERTEALAYDCAIARVEAGVFS
jgi:hypothetical protein